MKIWTAYACSPLWIITWLTSCVDFPERLPDPFECADEEVDCMPPDMVEVPAGEFVMGSNIENDELPVRRVHVDMFFIDETEVTVRDYAACVDDGVCEPPDTGDACNGGQDDRAEHPVNCVAWSQADAYCRWTGDGMKRLPTEAEWEKAARGLDARTYPWGDIEEPTCMLAVVDDALEGGPGCGTSGTMVVGSKPAGASPYGVQDMVGNVGEWVGDWYADSYGGLGAENPVGPMEGTQRVWRGGSWARSGTPREHERSPLRVAERSSAEPEVRSPEVGFRCVRTTLLMP